MLFTYDILTLQCTQHICYIVSSNGKSAKLHFFFENWRDTDTSGRTSNKLIAFS